MSRIRARTHSVLQTALSGLSCALVFRVSCRTRVPSPAHYRNGEAWWALRRPVQKLMMHPRAAAAYLEAQDAVAEDLLALLASRRDARGEVPDLYDILLTYTMECELHMRRLMQGRIQEQIEEPKMFDHLKNLTQRGLFLLSLKPFRIRPSLSLRPNLQSNAFVIFLFGTSTSPDLTSSRVRPVHCSDRHGVFQRASRVSERSAAELVGRAAPRHRHACVVRRRPEDDVRLPVVPVLENPAL